MLRINNYNQTFKRIIFQGANAIFYDGSIHAITGPSGCGKNNFNKGNCR